MCVGLVCGLGFQRLELGVDDGWYQRDASLRWLHRPLLDHRGLHLDLRSKNGGTPAHGKQLVCICILCTVLARVRKPTAVTPSCLHLHYLGGGLHDRVRY